LDNTLMLGRLKAKGEESIPSAPLDILVL